MPQAPQHTAIDEKGYYVPSDLMAWTGAFLSHALPG